MQFIPDILKFSNNEKTTKENASLRRKELIDILAREEYGYMPNAPERIEAEILNEDKKIAAGHAVCQTVKLSFQAEKGIFSFPFLYYKRTVEAKNKTVIMLNFQEPSFTKYLPMEEIIDKGFSVAVVNYQDIVKDNDDFDDGISAYYERKGESGWGKISMWAFGASRILDYLLTLPEVDADNIGICGHSRLGKTALWCGANDERIKFVYSNDSGCSGASYERVKNEDAESLHRIAARFPYWFCEKFQQYKEDPDSRKFDQHFLIGAIAPRYVCVGSASLDNWAGQYSEQLSCIGASPMWEIRGLKGFCGDETPCKIGERIFGGHIGYHLRDGIHYFSRNDWNAFLDFINENCR